MKGAIGRRDTVLKRMCELDYITPEQRDSALKERIHLAGLKPSHIPYKAPWFVRYVLQELADKYQCDEDMIYKGGLRVYTTLNYQMQLAAEESLRRRVREAKSRNVSQGALVCIDPSNGAIKAMVGGVNEDFSKDQYNRAVQAKRQPGSSFKAFVYTAAIDSGYDADYRISNARVSFPMGNGKRWTPRNDDGRYGGTRSMRQAMAWSVNVCAVRMADKIGIDKVITYARMLGIKSPLARNLSLALGACGVSPLELCSAYGVFAADGLRTEPTAVTRITTASRDGREGDVLVDNKPEARRVLSQETADTMCDLFRGVVTMRGGTGRAASRVPNAHGKTGTTTDDRDAWFVGFTPELVTAVWVGNDQYSKPMRDVWGGNVCAPAWADFMLKALEIRKTEKTAPSTPPDESVKYDDSGQPVNATVDATAHSKPRAARTGSRTVTICAESGLLATPQCPTTYTRTLKPGEHLGYCTIHGDKNTSQDADQPSDVSQPKPKPKPESDPKPAPMHSARARTANEYVTLTICADSGLIANDYCPETYTKTFLKSEAPRRICRMHRAPR
jgi:penicillin-binding protein 1A